MNQAALNAFLQELKTSINKLESVLINHQEPVKDSSLWYPPADKNYGPWITHNGNIPPVPYRTKIQRLSHAERHDRRFAARSEESCSDLWHDGIVAYRVRLNQWVPTPDKNYGPWIYFTGRNEVRDGLGEEIIKNMENRLVRVLTVNRLNKKRVSRARPAEYWKDQQGIIAYSVQNVSEKPWYPSDYVFGPWVETKGKDFHLHPDTRIQILTKDERDNKRSGKNPFVYSHVKDPACTPSYKDIVAYRIVTEQQ